MKKSDIISNNYYNAEGAKSFYKGTSFRVNKWAPDTYYFNDDQYVDWVIYNGVLCICERTHVSNMDNAPSIIYENKIPIGIESNPCWNFALGGLSAYTEDVYSDTTRIKISDEKLYISNDNGETWEYVGNVGSPMDPEQTSVTAEVVSVYESDTPSASVVVNNNHLQFSFALVKGRDGYSGKDGVDGSDGKDGTDGKDGITPKFKIENKYWYVSYDNGSTWEQVGKATGEDGKDGKDGEDGDTPEVDLYKNQYIFIRTQIPVNDFSLTPDNYQSDTNYQNDDYLPSYTYTDDEGKQQTLHWTKFATTVDETWEYQYWSYREKIEGIWGPYQKAALLNNYNTGEGGSAGIVPKVAYTSFVFCRSHKLVTDTDISPSGGSYENPHPIISNGTIGGEPVAKWYDAIPAGEGLVYMSTCEFNNETDYDTETAVWSVPVSLADTSDFQIEYSAKEIPNKPSSLQNYYDNDPINFESDWRKDNQDWIDYDDENIHNAIWMATATMHNNIWSDWSIVKIKGETGADGTPIHIVGSAETYADLPACNDSNLQIGDTYTVKTYIDDSGVEIHNVLFTYSGDDDNCWIYLGPIEGTGAYVHIKYATAPYNDNTKNEFDDNGIWKYFTKVEDETPGETPGDYIGIYTDSNPNDSLDPSLYTWKRWKGEDGWNYEYVYKLTNTKDAPRVPDISENYSNFVPDGWSDDPQEISKDNPYCWMVYRHRDYDESTLSYVWSSWIGSINNKEYAALWAHYGQDGIDGATLEYVYILDDTVYDGTIIPGRINEITKLPPKQSADYLPEYEYEGIWYKWSDNFIRPTIAKPYLWCSIRRYEWDDTEQKMLWSKFETPFLWTSYIQSITSLRIKVWKRFKTEVNDNIIKPSLTYDLKNNHIEFIEDNGWTISESSTDIGRYLYSLSVFVSGYSSDTITVNEGDWTTLILESVNGIDGSGQSESYISTDPDAILVNVDDNNIVTLGGLYNITSGYYYGSTLMWSRINISSTIGNITYTDITDQQHEFAISIHAGTEIMRSIPVKITLTPSDTSLTPLTDTIYITPIKSNDTWDIDTNVSQVICYEGMTPVTITAKILKNGKEYSGDDAKLEYTWNGDTTGWTNEGFTIKSENYKDIPNTLLLILIVNEATILHKTISIIKGGEKGDTGIGIKQVHEYYLWTAIGASSKFQANAFKEAVKNSEYSDTITLSSTFDGEEITETWTKTISDIDPTKPCLWNVEVIQYDNNDVQATDPALISQSGRGIKEVIEYYLVSKLNEGITTNTDGWDEKPKTVDKDHPYLWNYEKINFTDGTSITTDPVIIGVYSEGVDGVGVSNIVEYYLWSETEPNGFTAEDIGTLGNDIEVDVENGKEIWRTSINYAGTETKVWNIEVVKLTNGEYLVTDPVLISQFGKEIKDIIEWYLVTDQGSNVTKEYGVWTQSPGTISSDAPYLWNYEEIQYHKHETTYTTPVIIGVWNKGDDGKSIGDIFEFYYYGEEGEYPTPDWENFGITYSVEGTITVSDLKIKGTDETWMNESEYRNCKDVKSCLWNLEVTVFKDPSDEYTHSSPCLLSNRAHEIVSVEEYYLATNQDSNVVFSEDTIGAWTHVGANEPVPKTDASARYLWNAELITYFNREIKYTSPVRIGVCIKGDPGDPGDSAHIAELDFTNDIDNVSVNDEGKALYTKTYSNTVSLIYDGKPITEGVTYECSSKYEIDGLDYKFVDSVFNVTIPKDCSLTDVQGNILQSLPFKLQATATIDGKEVTAIKNFTLFIFKNIPLVSLDTNISRIYCDYEGYIYSDINTFEYEKVINTETQKKSRTKAFTIQSNLLGITIDDLDNYTVKLIEDGKVSKDIGLGDNFTETQNVTEDPNVLAEVTINLDPANKVRLYRMQLETKSGIILDYSDIEVNWGEAPKYFVDWEVEPFTVYYTDLGDENSTTYYSIDLNKEIKCIFTHNGIRQAIDPNNLSTDNDDIKLIWTLKNDILTLSQIDFTASTLEDNYNLQISYTYKNKELDCDTTLSLGYLNFNCVKYEPTFDLHTNSIYLSRKYTENFDTTYTVAYPIDYSCILKDVEYNDLTLDFADTQENSYITEAIENHKLQLLKLYEDQYYLVVTMEYGNSVNITKDPFYQIAKTDTSVNVNISTSKEVGIYYKNNDGDTSQTITFNLNSVLSLILTSTNGLRIKFAHKNAVIDYSDINQKLKWYFANLERDYISVDELYNLSYVCKYAIDVDETTPIGDIKHWIEVSEDHQENGLCSISTNHIVNNIVIAIFDGEPGNLVWYEVVKRTTNTSVDIVDYFNNIPSKVSIYDPMEYQLLDTTYNITYKIDDSLGKTTGEANIRTSGILQILWINRLQFGDIYLNAFYNGTKIATKIIHVENIMLPSELTIGSTCANKTAGVITYDKFSEYTVIHINKWDTNNFHWISLELPGYIPNIMGELPYYLGDKNWLNTLIGRSIKLKFVFNGGSEEEWFNHTISGFGLKKFKDDYGISYTSFAYVDNDGAADAFAPSCSNIKNVYLNPDKSVMLEIVYKSVLFDSGNGYYDTAIIPYVYPVKQFLSTL